VTQQTIVELYNERRLLPIHSSSRVRGGKYVVNPPLWVLPYFASHVEVEAIRTHRTTIIELLSALQSLVGSREKVAP
jgi:hypothetical protein